MIKGQLYVISGPSGVGKGTVVKKLLSMSKDIALSISATTRSPRDGEADGINYYFKSPEEFDEMISNNQLMEWAEFCGNKYGTPEAPVFEKLSEGTDVILEIETVGAMKIEDKYPEATMIFIVPPSLSELEKRLRGRGTETEEVILKRLGEAKRELLMADRYDYIVTNETVDQAADDLYSIIKADRFRVSRRTDEIKF